MRIAEKSTFAKMLDTSKITVCKYFIFDEPEMNYNMAGNHASLLHAVNGLLFEKEFQVTALCNKVKRYSSGLEQDLFLLDQREYTEKLKIWKN